MKIPYGQGAMGDLLMQIFVVEEYFLAGKNNLTNYGFRFG